MKTQFLHIKLSIVTTIVVTMLFSCESNFKEVQQIGILQNEPIGEAKDINLKYTEAEDSIGRVIANLESPKMLDYSNIRKTFLELMVELIVKIEA